MHDNNSYNLVPKYIFENSLWMIDNDLRHWEIFIIQLFYPEGGCGDHHFGWDYNLGWDYTGVKSKTASGYDCQRWDSQTPHGHYLTDPAMFADNSLDGASNYCRCYHDETFSVGYLWCHTTNPNIRWEHCSLYETICGEYCSWESRVDRWDRYRNLIQHGLNLATSEIHHFNCIKSKQFYVFHTHLIYVLMTICICAVNLFSTEQAKHHCSEQFW